MWYSIYTKKNICFSWFPSSTTTWNEDVQAEKFLSTSVPQRWHFHLSTIRKPGSLSSLDPVSRYKTSVVLYLIARKAHIWKMSHDAASRDNAVLIRTKTLQFDDVLQGVGDFSKFQLIQWTLLVLVAMPQVWYTYAPAFEARKVRESQIYCEKVPNVSGPDICSKGIWLNMTLCGDVRYKGDFSSIATDVSVSLCLTQNVRFTGA